MNREPLSAKPSADRGDIIRRRAELFGVLIDGQPVMKPARTSPLEFVGQRFRALLALGRPPPQARNRNRFAGDGVRGFCVERSVDRGEGLYQLLAGFRQNSVRLKWFGKDSVGAESFCQLEIGSAERAGDRDYWEAGPMLANGVNRFEAFLLWH